MRETQSKTSSPFDPGYFVDGPVRKSIINNLISKQKTDKKKSYEGVERYPFGKKQRKKTEKWTSILFACASLRTDCSHHFTQPEELRTLKKMIT